MRMSHQQTLLLKSESRREHQRHRRHGRQAVVAAFEQPPVNPKQSLRKDLGFAINCGLPVNLQAVEVPDRLRQLAQVVAVGATAAAAALVRSYNSMPTTTTSSVRHTREQSNFRFAPRSTALIICSFILSTAHIPPHTLETWPCWFSPEQKSRPERHATSVL